MRSSSLKLLFLAEHNLIISNTNFPTYILSEDVWRYLECLHKAYQAAKTDGGLFTDTGVHERGENERKSENDFEMKTVS